MSKLPYYLEAALSFRSIKDLNKRYSKFLNEITVGYECEISGGELGGNENEIDEDAEIEEFTNDFSWSEQQFLTKFTSNKSAMEVLDFFDITPKYGFADLDTSDKRYIVDQLRLLDYRVMGLPMENGDPIMEEPSINDYQGSRWEKEHFASTDTRLLNVAFAIKQAQRNLDIIKDIDSKFTFIYTDSYAIQYVIRAQIFIAAAIKNLENPEAQSNEILMRRNIYTVGHSINQYIKGWRELLRIMNADNLLFFFVYDENKYIHMLKANNYDDEGIKSPLLEWSKDGIEHFNEQHDDDFQEEQRTQLEEHLSDARNGINEDNSTVVDKIHNYVVDDVDENAKLSQGYHNSDAKWKGKFTVVEGDSSISPAGAEVVSPIFNGLSASFVWLDKVFDMIENHDMETNNSTGLHVNIGTFRSMAEKSVTLGEILSGAGKVNKSTIDVVKLAILSGDHYLLDQFGRLGNTYAHSLASNIRDLASANFDFKTVAKSGIYDTLTKLNKQFINQQADRYRTINMQHLLDKGYLEFRIAGGEDYHADNQKVKKAIYRYVQLCAVACDPQAYFKEYMTELYRLFVDNTNPADIQVGKTPRPKNVQEAMYIIRAWSSRYMEGGHGALPAAPKDRIRDAIAKGQSAFETDVLDMIAGIDTKLYPKVDANFLYAIRLLMLYSAKDKPNPRQYLKDNWNKYHNTSIKNYLAPKMYKNKPQWLRFFFTGSTVGVETNTGTLEASEEDYMSRINPGNKIVNSRPNFSWGDMYGMMPKGAKLVYSKIYAGLGRVSYYRYKTDIYATAINPDLEEQDVIGYSIFTNNETELHLIDSAQGKGIGQEIDYLYRKVNPYAPSGGFTKEGDRTARKTYHRLVKEKIIEAKDKP